MKIAVTGVAGFLGSHLSESLCRLGHEVVGCDHMFGGYLDNVPEQVRFTLTECQDILAMKKLFKGVDVVYHLAASAHEGLSVFAPLTVSNHTYMSTVSVVSAAVDAGVRRVILTSSMARYGKQRFPFTEDMPPAPVDPYGVAKYASEMLLASTAAAHGLEYVIAVPHNIYGPRQKYDDPYRNVVSIMTNRMLQGKQPYIYGDGEQVRCFTYVTDAVPPLIAMLDCASGHTVNIGPDEDPTSINEVAKIIAAELDFSLSPIYVPARPQEVRTAYCSAEKARDLLGYKTTVPIAEGIAATVAWIRNRGPRPFRYHIPLEIRFESAPRTWSERLM